VSATPPRVLLLLPTNSYKAQSFVEAAGSLGAELVVGTDRRQAFESLAPGHTLMLDFRQEQTSLKCILEAAAERTFDAVIGATDETARLAATVGQRLGLRHNEPDAVAATRDKKRMRDAFAAAGLRTPGYRAFAGGDEPQAVACEVAYPAVLKPLDLAASRGVIRVNGPDELIAAWHRVQAIVKSVRPTGQARQLLIEDYIPGKEFALEGLLDSGRLRALALFDKPDALEGPYFEETLYVTPARIPPPQQRQIVDEVSAACAALGLREGPVHAEVRLNAVGPWMLELAPRTIGGLCARVLRFGARISLEELVLRHALGRPTVELQREESAAGVMMIPIPRAGRLVEIGGLEQARALPGIESVEITLHRGARLVPLPEGNQYLGFIFARAKAADEVEERLRAAFDELHFAIED